MYARLETRPIGLGLHRSVGVRGPRQLVVDEVDVVANENFIIDGDTLANEGVARDLASSPDRDALSYFDERADFAPVADGAPVQIDERIHLHVGAQGDVRCDSLRGGELDHQLRAVRAAAPGAEYAPGSEMALE